VSPEDNQDDVVKRIPMFKRITPVPACNGITTKRENTPGAGTAFPENCRQIKLQSLETFTGASVRLLRLPVDEEKYINYFIEDFDHKPLRSNEQLDSLHNWFCSTVAIFKQESCCNGLFQEKNKKVLTPNLFWEDQPYRISTLFIYGYLRDDFPIMLGQVITYYIYIRNIQLEHEWDSIPGWLRIFSLLFSGGHTYLRYNNNIMDKANLFNKEHIPILLRFLVSLHRYCSPFVLFISGSILRGKRNHVA